MSSDNSFRMECPKCASTNVDLEEDQRAYLGGGRHQVQLHCYTCGHIIYGEKRIQAECDKQFASWERVQKDGGSDAAADAVAAVAAAPARAAAAAPAPAARARPQPVPEDDDDEDSGDANSDAGDGDEDDDAPAPSASPAAAPADAAAKAKPARPKAPAKAPPPGDDDDDDDQSDVAPGRATGTIDPETGLEIVVPSFDAPLDKKGRPLTPCTWPPCARYARPNSKYCSRNCSNKNARARYARRKDG